MPVDIEKYSFELQELAGNYYNQHIDFNDYRDQREKLLDEICKELNGVDQNEEQKISEPGSENFLNKMLDLLKKDEKEIMPE